MLHTWDQKLLYHVHLHCVIAGGALACDGRRWRPARPQYLFPVRALSQAFRERYLEGLRRAFARGQLVLPGRLAALALPGSWAAFLEPLATKDWVVYSQPPFGGPATVLEYLSRYTHRVAFSNSRLQAIADGRVTFTYRDRRDHNRPKELTLSAAEFIRRFLLHVLPKGFVRIRHYGLLAGVNVSTKLERCRRLLGAAAQPREMHPAKTWVERLLEWTGQDPRCCPRCQGPLQRHAVAALRGSAETTTAPPGNSSVLQPARADSS